MTALNGMMADVATLNASPRLVGREAELAALRHALETASSGETTAVLVGGDAGVGKTRLVSEFAAEAAGDGATVIVGQCVALGGDGLPFAPIAGALRDLLAQLGEEAFLDLAGPGRDVLPSLLPELGARIGSMADGRGRLFEVVTVLLERVSAERPLVVVIEDVHWADGSTRDLLRFVIRALGSARVVLVGTYRADELHRKHPLRPLLAELDRVKAVRRLDVPRLSRDQVAEQVAGLLGREPTPALVRQIFDRSEGIPFFVEELAASAAGNGDRPPMPHSLREILLVRAEQLSPEAQDVLRLLAVGGNRVDHIVVEAVADLDPVTLETALREAVSSNVIKVDGDGYVFRHALLREALHDDLLPGTHARLHTRYAEVLDERPDMVTTGLASVEIAHHWNAAHEQERAFSAYLRAADDAKDAYAHAEALRMLERALELWHRMPDPVAMSGGSRVRLLHHAARAAEDAGELERSLSLTEAALAEPDVEVDPTRFGKLLLQRAKLLSDLERLEALTVMQEALKVVPAEPPSAERAGLLVMLGARLMMDDRFGEALEVADEAIAAAQAAGDRYAEMRGENVRGPSLVNSGSVTEGIEAFERVRVLAEATPRYMIGYLINLSDAHNLLGRYATSARLAREGMQIAADVGLARSIGAMLAGNTAEPLLALGQWAEAGQLITSTLELDPPVRHAWHLLSMQAWLLLWQGDIEAAAAVLAELRSRQAGRSLAPQYGIPTARIAAEIALAAGNPQLAWDELASVFAAPHSPGYVLSALAAGARALAALRLAGLPSPDTGETIVRDTLAQYAEWESMPLWRAVVEAELAGDDAALWRAAIGAADDAEGPVHLRAYTRYRAGAALVGAGDRTEAAGLLRDAVDLADQMGAGLIQQWSRDLARRAGIRLFDEAPADTSRGLTPREREVLRLVADGRSNREIGDELFISIKTASVHVSNILTKLGVSSRVEAAAVAHREGLADTAA